MTSARSFLIVKSINANTVIIGSRRGLSHKRVRVADRKRSPAPPHKPNGPATFFGCVRKLIIRLMTLAKRPENSCDFSESGMARRRQSECLSARPVKGTIFGTACNLRRSDTRMLRRYPSMRFSGCGRGRASSAAQFPKYTSLLRKRFQFIAGLRARFEQPGSVGNGWKTISSRGPL